MKKSILFLFCLLFFSLSYAGDTVVTGAGNANYIPATNILESFQTDYFFMDTLTIGSSNIAISTRWPNMVCRGIKNQSSISGTIQMSTQLMPDSVDRKPVKFTAGEFIFPPRISKIWGTTLGSDTLSLLLFFNGFKK